jgi:hypothetical protein
MKILKSLTALALAASLGATGAWAQATPNFDFFGYVIQFPANPNDAFKFVSYIDNNGVVPTPIPLTWGAGVEHTLVIEAQLDNVSVAGPVITHNFKNATIRIYTDNGPAVPYAFTAPIPTGFENGDLILSGTIAGFFRRHVFSTLTYFGGIDWTGGSRLGELGANVFNYAIGGGGNDNATIPTGYDSVWDGKIDQPPVAVEETNWGAVKQLFKVR